MKVDWEKVFITALSICFTISFTIFCISIGEMFG